MNVTVNKVLKLPSRGEGIQRFEDFGPPRTAHSMYAWEREMMRQTDLLALGLMRWFPDHGRGVTYGWVNRVREDDGRRVWYWAGSNGTWSEKEWPRLSDHDEAWDEFVKRVRGY